MLSRWDKTANTKNDEHEIILSLFTCREFEYGYNMCKHCLGKINKIRKDHTDVDQNTTLTLCELLDL